MSIFYKSTLIILVGFLIVNTVNCQDLNIMTYNIRLDIDVDGDNAWPFRKDVLLDQVREYGPIVLGVQEAKPNQVAYMNKELLDYSYIGIGRDGGNKGEYSAIFYKKAKLELLKEGTFWLSSTPDKVSTGWDAALPRICSYALFIIKESQKQFWVFNSHFDHIGEEARYQSAQLITERIEMLNTNDLPVIVMGDMNAVPEDRPIQVFINKLSKKNSIDYTMPKCIKGTFNAFDKSFKERKIIDYIFFSNAFTIKKYYVDEALRSGRLASDHFPVIGVVSLN